MLSYETRNRAKLEVESIPDNIPALFEFIKKESVYALEMLKTHQQSDILNDHKSNISFALSYELSQYKIDRACKRIKKLAEDMQHRQAKALIEEVMRTTHL